MASYIIGVDLGLLHDRSALSIVEETPERVYRCAHLQVWQPGIPPRQILDDTLALIDRMLQQKQRKVRAGRSQLAPLHTVWVVLDITMAGVPIGHMFERALTAIDVALLTVTVTSGTQTVAESAWDVRLPKRDIASLLGVLLGSGRLEIARDLPYAAALRTEMHNFKPTKLTVDDAALDWRTREHDDLVLATALACWAAEYGYRRPDYSNWPQAIVVTRDEMARRFGI